MEKKESVWDYAPDWAKSFALLKSFTEFGCGYWFDSVDMFPNECTDCTGTWTSKGIYRGQAYSGPDQLLPKVPWRESLQIRPGFEPDITKLLSEEFVDQYLLKKAREISKYIDTIDDIENCYCDACAMRPCAYCEHHANDEIEEEESKPRAWPGDRNYVQSAVYEMQDGSIFDFPKPTGDWERVPCDYVQPEALHPAAMKEFERPHFYSKRIIERFGWIRRKPEPHPATLNGGFMPCISLNRDHRAFVESLWPGSKLACAPAILDEVSEKCISTDLKHRELVLSIWPEED